jgi:exopolyphosphatase/guanosine-5'-triphosphate,3'-diphosphate pyrophosphatase
MPLRASIDVGSNTLRLLIAEVRDNRIIDIYSDRRITRLGNFVSQTGMLQDDNMDSSLSALAEFSSIISGYGVIQVKAVGTSALREASNSSVFSKKVLDTTGITIEVISGQKEAELTLAGLLASFPCSAFQTPHSAFIVDIGGGSTEWILYRDKHLIDTGSVPAGVIKLTQKHIKTDPVSEDDMQEMNREIISALNTIRENIGKQVDKHTQLIGTGGTFTTIASIDIGLDTYSREKIHLHTVSLDRLQDMNKNLAALPLEERKKVKGLEPERADLIIPGIQFTISIMRIFGFDKLTISDYGLLEGALLEKKELIGKSISETEKP